MRCVLNLREFFFYIWIILYIYIYIYIYIYESPHFVYLTIGSVYHLSIDYILRPQQRFWNACLRNCQEINGHTELVLQTFVPKSRDWILGVCYGTTQRVTHSSGAFMSLGSFAKGKNMQKGKQCGRSEPQVRDTTLPYWHSTCRAGWGNNNGRTPGATWERPLCVKHA
jgi:hypothetical protein